jgi:nicotinate-nucleotide adenylyltransferase
MEEKRTSQMLLCFGGSFNPIHNGHLQCSRIVAGLRGFDRVMLIPSAQPPHKARQSDVASATDRLALCQLAAEGDPLFEASDIELRRNGPSYTIDTVRELKSRGYRHISWLIGADMLMIFPKWHQARELMQEATMLVMARPGVELAWNKLPEEFRRLQQNQVEAPLIDISATEIRRRIRAGESIDDLTPPRVAAYIREHRLYLEKRPDSVE